MSKSYFINNIDSYIGQEFLTNLKGTEEEPSGNTIIGTRLDAKNYEKMSGMKKVLKVLLKKICGTKIYSRDTSHYFSENTFRRWMF